MSMGNMNKKSLEICSVFVRNPTVKSQVKPFLLSSVQTGCSRKFASTVLFFKKLYEPVT
jgi:hypothetical protein